MGFDDVIIPGSLLGGLFSYQLGTRFPGRGTNWLKQRLVFLKPVYKNQEIASTVEITRIRPEKELINLSTKFLTSSGEKVVEGEALVHIKDVEYSSYVSD
jgi:acyl dehydratase